MATTTIKMADNLNANNIQNLSIDTTNVTSGSGSRYSTNNMVFVSFNIVMSASCTGTWTNYDILTGLPRPVRYGRYGFARYDGASALTNVFVDIGSDGIAYINVRETSVAGVNLTGYLMYPSREAYTV